MESLLEGISNEDRMSDLQSRLDALPADLEALFNRLLEQMGPESFQHACELFRLVKTRSAPSGLFLPTLWELAHADDNNPQSAIRAEIVEAKSNERKEVLGEMRRRLKSHCVGFLDVPLFHQFFSAQVSDFLSCQDMKVAFLHRTAKDFLYSREIWSRIMDATKSTSFNPDERWANGFLWCLKKIEARDGDLECRSLFTWCIEYALRLEKSDGKVRFTYLEEVGRAVSHRDFFVDDQGGLVLRRGRGAHFLELAFGFGLQGYVWVKAKKTGIKEVENIIAPANRVTLMGMCLVEPGIIVGRSVLEDAINENSLPKGFEDERKSAIWKIFHRKQKSHIPQFV